MIQHICSTDTEDLEGVYFEDVDALVSSKTEAWLVYNGRYFYFSTESAAEAFNYKLTGVKNQTFVGNETEDKEPSLVEALRKALAEATDILEQELLPSMKDKKSLTELIGGFRVIAAGQNTNSQRHDTASILQCTCASERIVPGLNTPSRSRHLRSCPLQKSFLFYKEIGLDAWVPVPENLNEILNENNVTEGELFEIVFKILRMTQTEFDAIPEAE